MKILNIAKHQGCFTVDRYRWSAMDLNNDCKKLAKRGYLKFKGIRGRDFTYQIEPKGLAALADGRFKP